MLALALLLSSEGFIISNAAKHMAFTLTGAHAAGCTPMSCSNLLFIRLVVLQYSLWNRLTFPNPVHQHTHGSCRSNASPIA